MAATGGRAVVFVTPAMGEAMASITVTFTITEFCLRSVTEETKQRNRRTWRSRREDDNAIGSSTIAQRRVYNALRFTRRRRSTGWDRGRVNAAGRESTAARRKTVTAATPSLLISHP